ncbi:MAG TPA: aminomethyl-transferring glycine dehydrogenase, partial [Usitatibacter sp.]|nr:aminomethyl-transferring glycine dehydrogenase [Usitatibacter sp.]
MPDTHTPKFPHAALAQLEDHGAFERRHIGPDDADQSKMLALLGFAQRSALVDALVPRGIRRKRALDLGAPRTEAEALTRLRALAERNQVFRNFIGQGYYECWTPGVILRNVFQNPAWYTAYTPYQPEISQGRLEALINFQTLVADLAGLAIANASMLDEATAAAEAMTLCLRSTKSKSKVFAVADDVFPQTIDVVRTRAEPLDIEVRVAPAADLAGIDAFAVLVQYPGAEGEIRDYTSLAEAVHARGGYVVAAADLLALTLIKAPGEWGADVAVGSAQRFGVPMGFGGPHAGFMAVRDDLKRSMPGRLVGVTVDSNGEPAYRLALQTREQHIRREKATSNICTAQVLLAVMASMYAVYHGPQGLKRIGLRVQRLAAILRAGLQRLGFDGGKAAIFDTVTVDAGTQHSAILGRARAARMNFRIVDGKRLGVSLDETTLGADVAAIWEAFAGKAPGFTVEEVERSLAPAIPEALVRKSTFLTHPVFNRHHSETEMLRYLRKLADKDVALDRSMIPLGSCTMKLNATSEMIPVTWREFGHIHPFAPAEQTQGYREMIADLEARLAKATGYAAVSLQPNAGSQGEYAGLLIIKKYHESRGEGHRRVCLIPSSAHGTNPASAQMVGMQVVVVACDDAGNVDLEDLARKAEQHSKDLAAVMVTYPSTHGVFEEGITKLCEIVHRHGGQVYVDGANMNAMVGLCAPGEFGGDVSHLNLHKTFCIPHGGGGPGMGPICAAKHLAPYLPGHPVVRTGGEKAIGPVASAP